MNECHDSPYADGRNDDENAGSSYPAAVWRAQSERHVLLLHLLWARPGTALGVTRNLNRTAF